MTSPFTIEVRFHGGLTRSQEDAFAEAADRWTQVIVGGLPSVRIDGEIIKGILILAQGVSEDAFGLLGQAGPTDLRHEAPQLPAKGIMSFGAAALAQMEADGTLNSVITHEMGHVLGFGTLWKDMGLLQDSDPADLTFTGPGAMAEYGRLLGVSGPVPVPVESAGGLGTVGSHWRETAFSGELMTTFIDGPGHPLSRVTVASLGDLGYVVDLDAAHPYEIPDSLTLAQPAELVAHTAPIGGGAVLPTIPFVLPPKSTVAQPSPPETPRSQRAVQGPSEELRRQIGSFAFEREEDCYEALGLIDRELIQAVELVGRDGQGDDLLAVVDAWASLISYAVAATYAPHSPMRFPGWTSDVPRRLREMCNRLRHLLEPAARQAKALDYSIGVSFPFGMSVSLGWSTP